MYFVPPLLGGQVLIELIHW